MEAAGLTVGVVALASMFTSCVELLDYFELGRNYNYDYDLACKKLKILQTRLAIWENTFRSGQIGRDHPVLCDPAKLEIISDSLESLKSLLSDTDGLKKRYNLTPVKRLPITSKKPVPSRKLAYWLHLRRRTIWSIRDKAKLDRFISDINFFMDTIENLKVTERVEDSDSDPDERVYMVTGAIKDLTLIEKRAGTTNQEVALRKANRKHQSQHSMDKDQDPKDHGAGTQSDEKTTTRIYKDEGSHAELKRCTQKNSSTARGLQGTVGQSGGHAVIIDSEQTNADESRGAQGALSETVGMTFLTGK